MNEKDELLRALLRQGDPAGDDPGLTREEAGRMRRAILTAAPEPRRRPVWLPVVAIGGVAAVTALTLAVPLGLWRARTDLPVHETVRRADAVPTPPALTSSPVPAPPPSLAVSDSPEAAPAARPRSRHTRRAATSGPVRLASFPAPPPVPEPAPPSPAEENEEPARQIQFSTPGGTRVIWVLSHEAVVE